MIPGATEEQMSWLDELQRVSTSSRNALEARRQRKRADVVHPRTPAPQSYVHTPTRRGDTARSVTG